jgi:HPt (histidine-containing phosphotransfer) domain-containing protein
MADMDNRFEQIIKQTRIVFIQECEGKMAEIQEITAQASRGEILVDQWIKTTYQHVHSMKGMALTLSYHQIDQSCQKIIHLIQEPREQEWAAADKNQLYNWINELKEYIFSPKIGE